MHPSRQARKEDSPAYPGECCFPCHHSRPRSNRRYTFQADKDQ
nr:MAG TPA: hypothetical protein [Caudoviricetes sp.]